MILLGIITFVFLFRSVSVSRLHLPEKQQNFITIILKIRYFFAFVRFLLHTKIKILNKSYKQTLIITTHYIYIYTIIHNLILFLN